MASFTECRLDERVLNDSARKRKLVREFLQEKGLSGVIIARKENFAWISTGGEALLIGPTDKSLGCLVFTDDAHYFVSHAMDSERIMEEQIPGQGYELAELRWYEGAVYTKAVELAGEKPAADIPLDGAEYIFSELVDLHYPMSALELERLTWLGERMNDIYLVMAEYLKPGLTENAIAAHFQSLHAQAGMASSVLIAGGDERFYNYRHPLPTENIVEKMLMLHSAPRRWGLHAPITRMYAFGKPEEKFKRAHAAVAAIQTGVFDLVRPGLPYPDLLAAIKGLYAKVGFEDEWRAHYQGGRTGYVIVDAGRMLTDASVGSGTPFEWFATVPGAKIAELTILQDDGLEMVSSKEPWPQIPVKVGDRSIEMPGIYLL